MARYSGLIGYSITKETVPGVWKATEVVKAVKGDIMRQSSKYQSSGRLNDDIVLNQKISIVGDAFAFENYYNIRWIEVNGFKWRVESIEILRPRIIVNLGGVWNS